MVKLNQQGAANGVVISLVLTTLLLIGALIFGVVTFSSKQDYKNNSDQKVAAAVKVAKQQESTAKDKQFAEDIKKPLKTYSGPAALGSLSIAFPKTWSGYVVDTGSGTAQLDGYFAPNVVPSASDTKSVFALRVQVVAQAYAQVVKGFESQQKSGKLTVGVYALPKLPNVVGVKATGQITDGDDVTMVVVPLRSQTLKIWTEGTSYLDDFNNNILPNFSFSP